MDDPAYVLDRPSNSMYFDFVNDFGALVKLNLDSGTSNLVKPSGTLFRKEILLIILRFLFYWL